MKQTASSSKRSLLVPGLALVMLVQTGLVVASYWPDSNAAGNKPWLSFKAADIDQLVVSDGKQSTHLLLKDKHWTVKELNLPADEHQIQEVIDTLVSEKPAWPSATTDEAATRFKVAEKGFERKVELKKGDTDEAVVYLGTSPHYGQIYGRREGDKDIMNISFNAYQAPADAHDWLDKSLLKVTAQPTMVTLPGLNLEFLKGNWQITDQPAVSLDNPKVDELVNELKELMVIGLADDKLAATLNQSKEGFVATLAVKDKAYHYQFRPSGDDWYARRDDMPQWFKVSTYPANLLKQPDLSKLEKAAPAKAAAATDSSGTATAAATPAAPVPAAPAATPPDSGAATQSIN